HEMPPEHDPCDTGIEELVFRLGLIENQFVVQHIGVSVLPDVNPVALVAYSGSIVGLEINKHTDAFIAGSPVTTPQCSDLIELQCLLVDGADQRCRKFCAQG